MKSFEKQNRPMKKITLPVFISIIVAFVVLAAVAVIIDTLLYNQYNYNNLISSFRHHISTTINHYSTPTNISS